MISKLSLNDELIIALSKIVDDAMLTVKRLPSHSEIEVQINRFNLTEGDPKKHGQASGKAKRTRSVLNWALEFNLEGGEKFAVALINLVKANGGFRDSSPNYVGSENIQNLKISLKNIGFNLTSDGDILHMVLDNLPALEVEQVLSIYIRRAKKGSEDAALLAGTSKDLLEAVAGHILVRKYGEYPQTANFPTLLGQAFVALDISTSLKDIKPDSSPSQKAKQNMEICLYELGCSINKLRNKEGTGHGRPFLPSISLNESMLAIESMSSISEYLLKKL